MKKAAAFFRTLFGFLLVLTAFPPMTVRLFRLVGFFLPAVGLVLIFWPQISKLLARLTGRFYRPVVRVIYVAAAAFTVFFITELAVIISGGFAQTPPAHSVLVVLGAKVNGTKPTLDLQGRIDAAGRFLVSHPDVSCIASGGRGPDEGVSEARCIGDTLMRQYHIAKTRIFLDENSYNTLENIQNTLAIIKQNRLPASAVLVTDGYHMFRARLLAGRCGLKTYACPAKTDPRLWAPMYVREVFALPKSLLLDRG